MPQVAYLYHVTTPEIARIIFRDGFKDQAAQKYVPGFGVTHTFDPGVWFADVPPITAICVDQFLGHTDEAWVCIRITPEDFDRCFVGNEWQDTSWPTRQWLIPAAEANKFPRFEMPLEKVLARRIDDNLTVEEMSDMIETEMTDETIKDRWRAALIAAAEQYRSAAWQQKATEFCRTPQEQHRSTMLDVRSRVGDPKQDASQPSAADDFLTGIGIGRRP